MNADTIDYLRKETIELIQDIPYCNWLYKLDSHYLKNIADNLNLDCIKNRETYFYINYLIKSRY